MYERELKMKKLLCLLLLAFTLVAGCAGNQHILPIRIGLIADSHITSPNGIFVAPYKCKIADEGLLGLRLKRSIRPLAWRLLCQRSSQLRTLIGAPSTRSPQSQ